MTFYDSKDKKISWFLIIILLITVHLHHLRTQNLLTLQRIKRLQQEAEFDISDQNYTNFCKPKKFIYLKVHKTGSSAIAMMLNEFAGKNNFTANLSKGKFGKIGGYPSPFNATLHKNDKKTDIITNHFRYNWPEIKKVLNCTDKETEPFGNCKNFKKIASVREPISHFRSSYNYYGMKGQVRIFKKCRDVLPEFYKVCRGEPYLTVNNGSLMEPIGKFLDRLILLSSSSSSSNPSKSPKNYLKSLPNSFFIHNFQSFEFNYMTPTQIKNHFDFILVNEYWSESLILLKYELCMDWEDVIPFGNLEQKMNSRDYEIEQFSKKQEKFLKKEMLDLDYEIYEMAKKEIERKIFEFGVEKMEYRVVLD